MPIDLNADVGESFGAYRYGDDEGVLPNISSANIACGFHAGDPSVMRSTVQLAIRLGVSTGAHPGFQDLAGFGRREMHLSAAELENLVAYQVAALAGIAAVEGVRLNHVKPHGALYNMAARDAAIADAIARAVRAVDASLVLFGLSGSQLIAAGDRAGLRVASEVFADRGYRPDGSLAPRATAGAVITDAAAVAARAVQMASRQTVTALDGTSVTVKADTICVHGDTPGAAALARAVRDALTAADITVASPR
jgi:5-oxoprolinase (ATP-hydrolysing) subunit A